MHRNCEMIMCRSCCRFNFGVGEMLPCVRVIEWHWGNLPSSLVYFKSWNNLSKSYGHFASTFWALEVHWQFWNGCWAIDKPCCVWPIILIFQAYNVESCSSYHVASPHDCNPATRLGARPRIRGFKICTIMVLGNMEDEHTFSNLFLHEIKVPKPFDYALGSHCVHVCIKVLHPWKFSTTMHTWYDNHQHYAMVV
jgi:hypothetical protein